MGKVILPMLHIYADYAIYATHVVYATDDINATDEKKWFYRSAQPICDAWNLCDRWGKLILPICDMQLMARDPISKILVSVFWNSQLT